MRLDKYLKVSRLLKRRTVAKQAADAGRAELNGRPVKPGHEVKVGDRLTLRLGGTRLTIEILETPSGQPPANRAHELYRVISEERLDQG